MDCPVQIIQLSLEDGPRTSAPSLPNKNALRQVINRKRRQNSTSTLILTKLPDWATKFDEEQFLFFNEDVDGVGRILIFTTKQNLQFLDCALYWIMDGTFRCTPHPFLQMYTIHALVGNDESTRRLLPMVYAFLPSKIEACYETLFRELKKCGDSFELQITPLYVLIDFEMAAINACKSIFPASIHKCYFFHFTQNMRKKIQKLGLSSDYGNDSDFALKVRYLFALAILPPDQFPQTFDRLVEVNIIPHKAHDLVQWFGSITCMVRKQKKSLNSTTVIITKTEPMFAPRLWSINENLCHDMPRSQNSIEAWHRRWNTLLNNKKWNLTRTLKELLKEQKSTQLNLERILAEVPRTPPRKKNKSFEDALQRVISTREEMDTMTF